MSTKIPDPPAEPKAPENPEPAAATAPTAKTAAPQKGSKPKRSPKSGGAEPRRVVPTTLQFHNTSREIKLPGVADSGLTGKLIVLEGPDGSGRSTQIALLKEWLECAGYAVETIGLRRSNLLARDIDSVMARNAVGRLTLALLYATDLFDQLENKMIPALRAGHIVLADRYVFTLVARSAVRGIDRSYLASIYNMALKPDLTFWLNVRPEVSFAREFRKSQVISYWESGRDLNLSDDLFESFILYQSMLRKEFTRLLRRQGFHSINGEPPVAVINRELRQRIAALLDIQKVSYKPSEALKHLWQE